MKIKFKTVMLNNSTNINQATNYLPPQLIEHRKDI